MNSREAKETLILFRPGTADEEDPSFTEARKLAENDPALGQSFREHCETIGRTLRQRFQKFPCRPA